MPTILFKMCLIVVNRSRYDYQKLVRRAEKKVKDANLAIDEERRTAEQYKEQVGAPGFSLIFLKSP